MITLVNSEGFWMLYRDGKRAVEMNAAIGEIINSRVVEALKASFPIEIKTVVGNSPMADKIQFDGFPENLSEIV